CVPSRRPSRQRSASPESPSQLLAHGSPSEVARQDGEMWRSDMPRETDDGTLAESTVPHETAPQRSPCSPRWTRPSQACGTWPNAHSARLTIDAFLASSY